MTSSSHGSRSRTKSSEPSSEQLAVSRERADWACVGRMYDGRGAPLEPPLCLLVPAGFFDFFFTFFFFPPFVAPLVFFVRISDDGEEESFAGLRESSDASPTERLNDADFLPRGVGVRACREDGTACERDEVFTLRFGRGDGEGLSLASLATASMTLSNSVCFFDFTCWRARERGLG